MCASASACLRASADPATLICFKRACTVILFEPRSAFYHLYLQSYHDSPGQLLCFSAPSFEGTEVALPVGHGLQVVQHKLIQVQRPQDDPVLSHRREHIIWSESESESESKSEPKGSM